MSIFDWIESDEGPNLDDFQGVTRSENGKIERGDRDDKPAKRVAVPHEYNEQESKAKLRAKLDDMGAKHKKAIIESGYGQVPHGQKSNYREAHEANARQALAEAVAEGQRRTSSPHSTPYGLAPSVYVETKQRYDFTPVLIAAFFGLFIFVLLGG
jgi:hypothetical protein